MSGWFGDWSGQYAGGWWGDALRAGQNYVVTIARRLGRR